MTVAGLWRYGDWRHVATGWTVLDDTEDYWRTHDRLPSDWGCVRCYFTSLI